MCGVTYGSDVLLVVETGVFVMSGSHGDWWEVSVLTSSDGTDCSILGMDVYKIGKRYCSIAQEF